MKKVFSLAFFAVLTITSRAQTAKQKLDSLVYYSQDSLGNNQRSAKNQYFYDAAGNCTLDESSYLNSITNTWQTGSRVTYDYDENHNDTSYINASWDVDAKKWIQYNKYVKTFNSKNKRTSETRFDMSQSTGQWLRVYKREYVYTSDNKIQTVFYYDSLVKGLKISYKVDYTYGTSVNTNIQSNWRDTAWRITARDESVLDAQGNATLITSAFNIASFDTDIPVWQNSSKQESVYNASNEQTQTSYFNWDSFSTTWVPTSRYIFVYDAYQNQKSFENQAWNKTSNQYESQYKDERTYDNNFTIADMMLPKSYYTDDVPPAEWTHMLLQDLSLGYDGTNWKTGAPNKYYYSPVTLTAVEKETAHDVLFAYPNPMQDVLNVSGRAELYDMRGSKVAEGEGTFSVSGLAKGLYLVKTNGGNVKVVKE